MADDFLSGLLGTGKQQDFASPLQVEIAKALMEKAAPEQMKYDPTIPGGWKASVVNALGNINSAMYRNQALRVNQGIIGNNARTATNLVVRPQDNQPAIKPSVVMKEQGDIKPAVNPASTVEPNKMNLGGQPNSDTYDFEGLPIVNGIDPKAPYMGRKRDVLDTKRIVFHGDTKQNVNDTTDPDTGKPIQGLLNYGREIDKQRGFDPNYHFYIDRDGTVTNGVPLDRSANHVGKSNKDSIGIVLAGVIGGVQPTDAQRNSASMLAQRLAKQYGLSAKDVVTHPELQPGHRTPDEAGNVAADIRRNWPGNTTPQNQDETAAQTAQSMSPLSRGGIAPNLLKPVRLPIPGAAAQLAEPETDPFHQVGNPAAAGMNIPGITDIPKNIMPQGPPNETTIPKNVMPGRTAGLMALGAGNAPGTPDPSQIAPQNRGATPWSVAQQQAQEALQKGDKLQGQVPNQEPQYLPDEQKELNTPLSPVRTAQNIPDRTGRPGVPQGQSTGFSGMNGYNGPIPSVPSLPSEKAIADRIHALAIHGDMEGVNEFVQDIQKKMQPQIFKVPNGELHVTPKHYPEPNQVQFFPSAETKGISAGGVSTQMGPQFNEQGQLEQKLRVPGPTSGQGAGGGMNSLEDFATEGQRIGAQGEATSKLYGEKAAQINEAITQGQKSNNAIQRLDTMMALSKAGGAWTPAGPTKDAMLKMRQFLDNFGVETKGTLEGEIFDKFNSFLASESTNAITSRGTNFDLETFMRANPSLLQSKEGRESLIDILKQEYRARQYIGRRANELSGKDVGKLTSVIEEYYRSHPIKFDLRVDKENRRINAYPVKQESDLDHIESGEWFIAPNGKMGRKP